MRWRGVLALNFIRRTELPTCTNVSVKHGTPAIANPLLADALLSVRSAVVSSLHTLSKKRFTLDAQLVVFAVSPCVGENNFIKKRKGGKNFSWVGEKNTLLKTLVVRCIVRFLRVYFFVRWLFLFLDVRLQIIYKVDYSFK